MQATDENTTRLHQEATGHYLQGRFPEALALWRQLLDANPQDERALEGVRLCELLTDENLEGAEAPARNGDTGDDPLPFETAPADGAGTSVPDFDIDLASNGPDPHRQMEGLDLGQAPEALGLAGDAAAVSGKPAAESEPEPVIPEVDAALDMPEIVVIDEDVESNAISSTHATETELANRVESLIVEATAAYAQGDHETARGVLARVAILDEDNVQAQNLLKRIEQEANAAAEAIAEPAAEPAEDLLDGFDIEREALEAESIAPPVLQETEFPAVEAPLDPVASEAEPLVDPDAEFEDFEPVPHERPVVAAKATAVRIQLPRLNGAKTKWIVIGAVVAVLVVVGSAFWIKLQEAKSWDEVPSQRPVAATPEAPAESAAGGSTPEARPSTPATPLEELDVLLTRGREAQASGDYAAAIVAFHAILEQDPAHVEAMEQMEVVTAAYREQQAVQQQWDSAVALFRDEDYRSAMKMFYRLPLRDESDGARLERYKAAGWYNMGLHALRGSNCENALAHFSEAQQIAPDDPGIAKAVELATSCEGDGSRRNILQRAVESLEVRTIDD